MPVTPCAFPGIRRPPRPWAGREASRHAAGAAPDGAGAHGPGAPGPGGPDGFGPPAGAGGLPGGAP